MSEYFRQYSTRNSEEIRIDFDLTNYATKTDLNNITHVDTSSFALKTNLTSLKAEVVKLDIPKLVTVPTELSNKEEDHQTKNETKLSDLFTKV